MPCLSDEQMSDNHSPYPKWRRNKGEGGWHQADVQNAPTLKVDFVAVEAINSEYLVDTISEVEGCCSG